jgi:hypothetical protein
VEPAPVLYNESWAKLAGRREYLCANCLSDRARERGIKITLADLVPFAFNLAHRPYSWFDFFAKRGVPADVFDKWKEVDDSMVRHTYIEASKDGAPADIAEKWKEAEEFSQGRWVPAN